MSGLVDEERDRQARERNARVGRAQDENPFLHPEFAVSWYDCGPLEMVSRAFYLVKVVLKDFASGGRRYTQVRWNKLGCRSEFVSWRRDE